MGLSPRIDRLEAGDNKIINGNMDFWQRNTSFSISATSYTQYTADRWCFGKDATPSTITVSRSTDVPTLAQSGYQSQYSLLATNNASGNSPAAADSLFINHRLEGYEYQQLHGKPVRISFWVKSSVAGVYSFLLINKITGSNSRNYATTYTINTANTWEKKVVDVTLDSAGAGTTWALDNSIGLVLHWSLAAGASVQTSTLNTWQTSVSQVSATTSQTNWTGTGSATFQLAQAQLVQGSFSSTADLPFKRAGKTIQTELAMCTRYYEQSSGANATITANDFSSSAYTGAASRTYVKYSVNKRAAASITTKSDTTTTTGTTSMPYTVNGVNNYADGVVAANTDAGFALTNPSANATSYVRFGWTADAEL